MDVMYSKMDLQLITLKKLLIKINLRNELEIFKKTPSLWKDDTINGLPMLNTFFLGLRACPLIEKILAPLQDKEETFDQLLTVLPALSEKFKHANYVDILTQIINDIGNMWTGLMMVMPEELSNVDIVGESVFDDLEVFQQNFTEGAEGMDEEAMYQVQFVAQSRIVRAQTLYSVRIAVSEFESGVGFEQVLEEFLNSDSLENVPKGLYDIFRDLFNLLDLLMGRATSTKFRRDALERNATSMTSKFYGALINSTNPMKVLPFFMKHALKTRMFGGPTIAEYATLRPVQKKLDVAKKPLPPNMSVSINNYAREKINVPAAKISMNHVNEMLEKDKSIQVSEFVSKQDCLNCLKYSALLCQKERMMEVFKTEEFLFILDKFSPLVGEPLSEIFQAMRIGVELRKFGMIFIKISKCCENEEQFNKAKKDLHDASYVYLRDVLKKDQSLVLRKLLVWLYDAVKKPRVVSVSSFLEKHCDDVEKKEIWEEVAYAKDQLQKGAHFVNLKIPKTRELAKQFHIENFVHK